MFKLGSGIAILLFLSSYGCKNIMTKGSRLMEDDSGKPSKTDNNEFVNELKANFVYGMSKIAENLVKSDEKEVLLSNAQMQAMVAGVPLRFREFFCDVSKVKLEKFTIDGKSQLGFNMSFTNKIIGKEIVNGVYMTHDVSLYTSRDDQLKGIPGKECLTLGWRRIVQKPQ
ncbi:MAG: hypothetical protein R3B45_05620 [Bdellovibrionota bacterium]